MPTSSRTSSRARTTPPGVRLRRTGRGPAALNRATSPQPTRPSPPRTQHSGLRSSGSRSMSRPGSSTGLVRTPNVVGSGAIVTLARVGARRRRCASGRGGAGHTGGPSLPSADDQRHRVRRASCRAATGTARARRRAGRPAAARVGRTPARRLPEVVAGIAVLVTVLAALALVGAAIDDQAIGPTRRAAQAEVLDGLVVRPHAGAVHRGQRPGRGPRAGRLLPARPGGRADRRRRVRRHRPRPRAGRRAHRAWQRWRRCCSPSGGWLVLGRWRCGSGVAGPAAAARRRDAP